MLASYKSDFYLLRGYLKTYIGTFALMIVFSVVQKSSYFAYFYPAFMAVFTPFSLFSLAEQSGWESMLLSAPITRADIVRGRYMMCLSIDLIMLLVGFITALFLKSDISSNIAALLLSLAAVLVLNSLVIPIVYKFGATKGRFAVMVICILPAIVFPLIGSSDADFDLLIKIVDFLQRIPVLLVIDACCLVLLGLSYFISSLIYNRKEF